MACTVTYSGPVSGTFTFTNVGDVFRLTTPGTYTLTFNFETHFLETIVGGGGGGGGTDQVTPLNRAGGGGGGAGRWTGSLVVAADKPYTLVVGNGGAGGTNTGGAPSDGTVGENTSLSDASLHADVAFGGGRGRGGGLGSTGGYGGSTAIGLGGVGSSFTAGAGGTGGDPSVDGNFDVAANVQGCGGGGGGGSTQNAGSGEGADGGASDSGVAAPGGTLGTAGHDASGNGGDAGGGGSTGGGGGGGAGTDVDGTRYGGGGGGGGAWPVGDPGATGTGGAGGQGVFKLEYVGVQIGMSTLGLSGQIPSLGRRREPDSGAIALTGLLPTLNFFIVKQLPAATALTLTGQAPFVSLMIAARPPAGAIAVTGQAPAIPDGGITFKPVPAGQLALTGAISIARFGPPVVLAMPNGVLAITRRQIAQLAFEGPFHLFVDGVDQTANVLVDSVTVRDPRNQPRRCSFKTTKNYQPPGLARLELQRGAYTYFYGTVTNSKQSYVGGVGTLARNTVFEVSGIGDNFLLRRRFPIEIYTNQSATTVGNDLIAKYGADLFTSVIQAGLPTVTITFNGEQDLGACFDRLAQLIGGYTYEDNHRVHLFLTEIDDAPQPLDATNRALFNNPPIAATDDWTQICNRVLVRGKGSAVVLDSGQQIAIGASTIPLLDTSIFASGGGGCFATGQRFSYGGRILGGAATVLSTLTPSTPSDPPGSAPFPALSGVGSLVGSYKWKVAFGTAAGETIPGPETGPLSCPAVDPPPNGSTGGTVGPVTVPGQNPTIGPLIGAYLYKTTFVTARGETLPQSLAFGRTAQPTAPPGSCTIFFNGAGPLNGVYNYKLSFVSAIGESLGGGFGGFTATNEKLLLHALPLGPPGTLARRIYRTKGGGVDYFLVAEVPDNTTQSYDDKIADLSLTVPPPIQNRNGEQHLLQNLFPGPSGTLGRRIYRTVGGGSEFKFVGQLSDNFTTSFLDVVPDGSLGGAPPLVSTAGASAVLLSSLPIGAAGVTQRIIYRTVASGTDFKYVGTVNDNSGSSFLDAVADDNLGRLALVTSNIPITVVESGGAPKGGTSLTLVSAAGLPSPGWFKADSQLVRYSGIVSNTLTGIPTAGDGSITSRIQPGASVTILGTLTGVSGLVAPLVAGDQVRLLVQMDDAASQALAASHEGGTGIHETPLDDPTLASVAACQAAGQAKLNLFSTKQRSFAYTTPDRNTRSGKPLTVNLPTVPAMSATLVIQDVTIGKFHLALGPFFTVVASTTKITLQDILTRLAQGRAT